MLDGARDGRAANYPPEPASCSTPDRWRVQCLLMAAEFRYGLYLRMLKQWVQPVMRKTYKLSEEWPLPPL